MRPPIDASTFAERTALVIAANSTARPDQVPDSVTHLLSLHLSPGQRRSLDLATIFGIKLLRSAARLALEEVASVLAADPQRAINVAVDCLTDWARCPSANGSTYNIFCFDSD